MVVALMYSRLRSSAAHFDGGVEGKAVEPQLGAVVKGRRFAGVVNRRKGVECWDCTEGVIEWDRWAHRRIDTRAASGAIVTRRRVDRSGSWCGWVGGCRCIDVDHLDSSVGEKKRSVLEKFEWGARDVVVADGESVDVELVAVCAEETVDGGGVGCRVRVTVEAARVT